MFVFLLNRNLIRIVWGLLIADRLIRHLLCGGIGSSIRLLYGRLRSLVTVEIGVTVLIVLIVLIVQSKDPFYSRK